jgi:UDPglucose--hexose-1-phosphate uridylyltransferase
VVVAARQGRPNLPSSGCPFCPGGQEAPGPYDVRWFPNRWPPLPDGRSEVVLFSPVHDASLATLGIDGATRVVDLWADRSAALGARPDVHYVLVFENRGAEVGATISHPPGQIYAFDLVPPEAATELATGDVAAGLGPGAEGPDDDRLVCRSGPWRAFVPWAAAWPFALVLAPDERVPDLPSLSAGGRRHLATCLIEALGRLDALFDEPMPYMLWIHQRPFDGGGWPRAWVHVHVAPRHRGPGLPRFVASAEVGSGVYFNPVDPAHAADLLRRAGGPDAGERP